MHSTKYMEPETDQDNAIEKSVDENWNKVVADDDYVEVLHKHQYLFPRC